MMTLLPPAEDRRVLYLGLMSAVVLWTAGLALAF
jgi:predicted tellurium resistance membrane protein TerC